MKEYKEELYVTGTNSIELLQVRVLYTNFRKEQIGNFPPTHPSFTVFISDPDIAGCLIEDFDLNLYPKEISDGRNGMINGYGLEIFANYETAKVPPRIGIVREGASKPERVITKKNSSELPLLDTLTLTHCSVRFNTSKAESAKHYKPYANATQFLMAPDRIFDCWLDTSEPEVIDERDFEEVPEDEVF